MGMRKKLLKLIEDHEARLAALEAKRRPRKAKLKAATPEAAKDDNDFVRPESAPFAEFEAMCAENQSPFRDQRFLGSCETVARGGVFRT
jgi:hypothetical protein